ncbi:MAG: hypothetical protein J6Z80_05780 [Clostridia bacterium]|nr:hypothetical protein [Clostridia bacterium]
MKKTLATILIFACLSFAVSCSRAWQGYENENLDSYIAYGELRKISYGSPSVTDGDVEKEFFLRLETLATDSPVAEPFGEGRSALINAFPTVDGEPYPQAALSNVLIVPGFPGDPVKKAISGSVAGKSAGEESSVTVTVPAGYFREIPREFTAEYSVSILQVYVHAVPELSEETCQRINPGSSGPDYIKDEIRNQLVSEATKELREAAAYAAWNEYLAAAYIKKLPYEVYIGFYNRLEYPYEVLAEAAEKTLEQYIAEDCGMEKSEFERDLSAKALEKTKNALLINATAKNAGIVCDETTLSAYAGAVAEGSDGEFENGESYIDYVGEDQARCDCLLEMIFDYYTEK